MTRSRTPRFASSIALLMVIAVAGVAWWGWRETGKSPGELMDYAEHRLQGHTGLERAMRPVIEQLRLWLKQPPPPDLLPLPFVVPPVPTRVPAPVGADAGSGEPVLDSTQSVIRVGPSEAVRSIAQAAQRAKDGDIVEIDAGDYQGDVAVWLQKKLTIRTRGGVVRLFAAGQSAEGKAIWVLRNGDFSIDNIQFIGTHVSDNNGAGIRFENGNLHISHCLFWGNDTGLLTTGSAGTLTIEDSEFAYSGVGDGFSHNLYVGKIDTLKVTGSYFHHGNVGHLMKSRAHHNYLYYNRMTDETGGRASYELDLPNGGMAYVVGNIIEKSSTPQNSTLISFGAEGLVWPENQLYLASNTLVNDQAYDGTYVRTAPGTQRLVSANNLLVGPGKFHIGSVSVESSNDRETDWSSFVQASRFDYRLSAEGQAFTYRAVALPDLVPHSEYDPAPKARALTQPPQYPGALQTH